ncbi:MAG: hypothetical protein DWI48_06775 [Chloroflexi bacterium]|nr:MAG: hypothetical protein DWI48_06775 [Chloroflexota bacterium]
MVPGLIAGAVGALIAVLLSLPLQSPDDIFFNSLTVGLGGTVLALIAGAVWNAVQRSSNAVRAFTLAMGAGFVLVVLAALGLETQMSRSFSYIAPIAAANFGAIVLLTPMLAQRAIPMWAGAVGVVLPLALGVALMSQHDTQTTALALPSSTSIAATTATSTTASSTATTSGTASSSATAAATTAAGGTTTSAAGTKTTNDVKGVTYVVSDGSTSQFVVREKIAQLPLPNDATMKNTAITGNVYLDGRPTVVNLDMTKFSSDQSMRDRFISQQWGRSNATTTVTIGSLSSLPTSYKTGETVKQKVSGTIKVQGNEVPITFDVEAKMDESGTLNVLASTSFKWSDLKMTAPSTPTVAVQDEVAAQVLLVAKPTKA